MPNPSFSAASLALLPRPLFISSELDCKMWLSPNPRLLPGLLVCLSACRLCLAVVFTNSDFSIQPNKAFNLKWDQNEGPVTLSVVTGTSDSAQQVVTIAGEDVSYPISEVHGHVSAAFLARQQYITVGCLNFLT